MTNSTKIWIWIAVATIVIAGLGVGGFFLLKKDDSDDNGKKNGENANFTPTGNGTNNSGSKTTESNTNSSTFDVDSNANKLKKAIYGLGTDSETIYSVFDSITTQDELDSLLEKYKSLTKNEFKTDLHDELKGEIIKNEIVKKLDSKGLTMEFVQSLTEKQKNK